MLKRNVICYTTFENNFYNISIAAKQNLLSGERKKPKHQSMIQKFLKMAVHICATVSSIYAIYFFFIA